MAAYGTETNDSSISELPTDTTTTTTTTTTTISPKLPRSSKNINLSVWGPCLWTYLHVITIASPKSFDVKINEYYRRIFGSIADSIPCITCQLHFKEILQNTTWQFRSRLEFVVWLYDIHNQVNMKLGKPKYSYIEFLYENLPSSYYPEFVRNEEELEDVQQLSKERNEANDNNIHTKNSSSTSVAVKFRRFCRKNARRFLGTFLIFLALFILFWCLYMSKKKNFPPSKNVMK